MPIRCCDMHAGKLKEPVTFQRRTLVSDGAGGQTETWSTLAGAPTRAFVTPTSGSERFASDRTEGLTRLRLVVRYVDLVGADQDNYTLENASGVYLLESGDEMLLEGAGASAAFGLSEADRVIIRGRVHNIRFVDNIEFANKWLQIDVDGGVAA